MSADELYTRVRNNGDDDDSTEKISVPLLGMRKDNENGSRLKNDFQSRFSNRNYYNENVSFFEVEIHDSKT
jgi:hypothetical protein